MSFRNLINVLFLSQNCLHFELENKIALLILLYYIIEIISELFLILYE